MRVIFGAARQTIVIALQSGRKVSYFQIARLCDFDQNDGARLNMRASQ